MFLLHELKSISQLWKKQTKKRKEKKKKKHDKIVLLGKDKINTIEVLISKALNNSSIHDDEFVSLNNVLRKYWKINERNKNS